MSVFLLSACESIVKNALLDAKSYPASTAVTQKLKSEFDIETREFCDNELDCYQYYFAPSKAQKAKLSMNNSAHFTDKPYSTSLLIKRQDVPAFAGSVLIIHGFRGSKDWGLLSAAYFQFLGFDVYVIDLLGHGDLRTSKGFGVKDASYLKRFIEANIDASKPILAVGNSMGGLVATTLVNQGVVDAAILQAPMTQFDESLLGYFKDKNPWYGFLISDPTLQHAANGALKDVGLSANETSTVNQLKVSSAPILIFASTIDSVSPYAIYAPLRSNTISVIEIDQVEHAYMSMIGQFEHAHILQWLSSLQN